MNKKSTHWVTIPEEKVHMPAPSPKEKKNGVNHKGLWAAGFIVVIILGFTLVAPQQMANLLQGNLFDTSGVPQEQVEQPIQPLEILPEQPAPAEEAVMEKEPETPAPQNVVEAQTEAVSIQIAPVAEPETKMAEGEAMQPETVAEAQPQPARPAGGPADEELKAELDANRKLLEELSKQLAEVKGEGQAAPAEAVHSAASDTAAEVTSVIGQPQAATPSGYRPNPYRVTVTPQQVLQQNTAVAQANAAPPPAIPAAATQTYYDAQLAAASGTPESGPALTVALILTFVTLVGWRFRKIFV